MHATTDNSARAHKPQRTQRVHTNHGEFSTCIQAMENTARAHKDDRPFSLPVSRNAEIKAGAPCRYEQPSYKPGYWIHSPQLRSMFTSLIEKNKVLHAVSNFKRSTFAGVKCAAATFKSRRSFPCRPAVRDEVAMSGIRTARLHKLSYSLGHLSWWCCGSLNGGGAQNVGFYHKHFVSK